jgi:transcriptional regulator with XRE-family HTH domain
MTPATLILIRKAEQQSIAAFARRLGIGRNTLTGYERGKQPIPPYIALAVTCIYRRMEPLDTAQ